jgi:uncharacterized protein (DUF2336 family)
MIINQFRIWARTAAPTSRADGASALARAYLYSGFDDVRKREALVVLAGFLDDPSPLVRAALAEAFACSPDAPHHIVLALADDQSSIAAVVLALSPVLSDGELIDCAATSDPIGQSAIASRPDLPASVSAALCEIAGAAALTVLAGNETATICDFSIHRMIERHGDCGELREALLRRLDLPPAARLDLVAATMRALSTFVTERNWMSGERVARVAREAKDKAAIVIAESSRGWRGALDLAAHLRASGDLTAGFALRTILSGRIDLFKACLSELSSASMARVDGLVDQPDSAGFAAIYGKAGLPLELLPAFRIALRAAGAADWTMARASGLSRQVIERVLTACDRINAGDLDKLLVLLRRFETEAAREEARCSPPPDARAIQVSTYDGVVKPEAEPLLLKDLDTGPTVRERRRVAARREPRLLTIDMAALEAELCAA